MSNESKQMKPDCTLIGENRNVFHLVGIVARALNALSANAENAGTVCPGKCPK